MICQLFLRQPSRSGIGPRWLMPCVLKQWERPGAIDHQPLEEFAIALRHPARVANALRVRWLPNPIAATICPYKLFQNPTFELS